MHKDAADILAILTSLRRKSGDSQSDLADAMGVTQPTVSSWEKAKHAPPLWQTFDWAQRYGFTLEVSPVGGDSAEILRQIASIAAGLDQSKLDNLLALAQLTRDIPIDVSDSAISLMRSIAAAVATKGR